MVISHTFCVEYGKRIFALKRQIKWQKAMYHVQNLKLNGVLVYYKRKALLFIKSLAKFFFIYEKLLYLCF